jgi:hypothetical protein
MNCERIQPQLSWYLYNELSEQERSEVEEHAETCAACSAELERERAFLARLSARKACDPPPALLAECRHDLMRSIYRAERLRTGSARERAGFFESLGRSWQALGYWRQPVAALCLLAVGFFGGWRLRTPAPAGPASPGGEPLLANISGVSLDPQAGRVQISYDEVRRQTLNGTLQDPVIQGFLISAARSYGNPGVRLETIGLLTPQAGNREIRQTLLYALSHDRNPGVRLKALEALQGFAREPDVRQALAQVLIQDENPGMRVQAIDLLTQHPDENLVGLLQDVAGKQEENNYVRMRCERVLREMNASVESF